MFLAVDLSAYNLVIELILVHPKPVCINGLRLLGFGSIH
jgi:hypothetical protein